MRVAPMLLSSLLLSSTLALAACKTEQPADQAKQQSEPQAKPQTKPESPAAANEVELGAQASSECRAAMDAFAKLDSAASSAEPFTTATIQAAWTGPLQQWVAAADSSLARKDAKRIDEALVRLETQTDPAARRHELVQIATAVETVALLEARRLLTSASDPTPERAPDPDRAGDWDDAWCMWSAALRPLAARADALPKRGGEDWEATIVEAFEAGRAALGDPITRQASRQIIEKGSYAVVYRLILANAEDPQPPALSEAAAMLDMLEDRIADRNAPGLARTRQMLDGAPTAVDPAAIERDLAVAFCKRARKYCDKAVIKAELGSPEAIAETWEGILYTKVILPSMREALSAAGFDADAYTADWQGYLEAVETADAETAAETSTRLVEWNCAYQDHLGISECSSTSNELK